MIGKNLTKIREDLNISQRELGRRIGMSGQMISKIENNLSNPSMETLIKISEALECSLYDLTMDTEQLKNDVKIIESEKYIIKLAEKNNIKITEEYDNDGNGEYLNYVYISFKDKDFKLSANEFHELSNRIIDSLITNIAAAENYNLLK